MAANSKSSLGQYTGARAFVRGLYRQYCALWNQKKRLNGAFLFAAMGRSNNTAYKRFLTGAKDLR